MFAVPLDHGQLMLSSGVVMRSVDVVHRAELAGGYLSTASHQQRADGTPNE